jgi:hypothetical protein
MNPNYFFYGKNDVQCITTIEDQLVWSVCTATGIEIAANIWELLDEENEGFYTSCMQYPECLTITQVAMDRLLKLLFGNEYSSDPTGDGASPFEV